ncbi:MAG: hypothetical protein GF364_12970, partial [Candidatus Lokiarchaeota archaeon]|nr:hypothetical protein [Candidatus Lokiarchaeota archaeon]
MSFEQEDTFAKAKQLVAEAIDLLNSGNPVKIEQGMDILDSHDAFHSRKMAYPVILKIYPDQALPDLKKRMLSFIAQYAKGDKKAFAIFKQAAFDTDDQLVLIACKSLYDYPEGVDTANMRLRQVYEMTSSKTMKMSVIKTVGKAGTAAEPLLDIITDNLAVDSWLLRRWAKKATKRMIKDGVNVVGYLVNLVETGNVDQKVAGCAGLGGLGKKASGSVDALRKALSDDSVVVRGKAAWALSKMKKKAAPAEKELKAALKDESPAVNKSALKALKNIKKLSKEQKKEIKEMEDHEKELKKFEKKQGFKPKKE